MREVATRSRISPRVVDVCLALGLTIRKPARFREPARVREAERALLGAIRASRGRPLLISVTGPSGGGKSTLLRALAKALRAGFGPPRRLRADVAAVDAVRRGGAWLARAGLAESAAMIASARELSEGQRHRLLIARLMDRRSRVVIIDEFASTLDRPTAMGVAMGMRRWAHAAGKVVVCATAHDDVERWLDADLRVRVPLAGEIEIESVGDRRSTG
jgi:ABC-type lipoprotein export system ATPase subunit